MIKCTAEWEWYLPMCEQVARLCLTEALGIQYHIGKQSHLGTGAFTGKEVPLLDGFWTSKRKVGQLLLNSQKIPSGMHRQYQRDFEGCKESCCIK